MGSKEAKAVKSRKVKKVILRILLVLLTLIVIFVVLNLTGVPAFKIMAKQNIKQVSSERVNLSKPELKFEKVKYGDSFVWEATAEEYESSLKANGSEIKEKTYLKALHLTDLHFSGGFLAITKDGRAINSVKNMVEWAKPDIIIVTGDALYPIPIQGGSINNGKTLETFANLMDQFKLPWTFVYGNHDTETMATHTKEQISEMLEKHEYNPAKGKYALYLKGPDFEKGKDEKPLGNYQIVLKNKSGKIIHALFMMDSNKYAPKGDGGFSFTSYDKVHDDQIEWYKKSLEEIKKQNSGVMPTTSVFIHIPFIEYSNAWKEVVGDKIIKDKNHKTKDASKVKYFGGDMQEIWGESKKTGDIVISHANKNMPNANNFYENIRDAGSTKFVFCGHDHDNNFSVETKDGIRLTYGKSIDHLAYIGITNRTWQRGGTLLYFTGKEGDKAVRIYQKKECDVKNDKLFDFNTEKTTVDTVRSK